MGRYLITSPTHPNEMAILHGELMGWVARTSLCIHFMRHKNTGQDQFLRQIILMCIAGGSRPHRFVFWSLICKALD